MDDRTAAQYAQALADAGIKRRPVAVLDLDVVDANLVALARRASGTPIRVASKSLRVRHLVTRALAAPCYSGVLAYTLTEALWLVGHGVDDVVLAYPTVDTEALARLAADDAARAAITLMVDCTEHLDVIDRAVPGHPPLRIALELDAGWRPHARLGFGALRSPVYRPEDLVALARAAEARPGFDVVGIMAYEGQIAGVADAGRSPYQRAVRGMKRLSTAELATRRAEAVRAVREIVDLEFVNGGGTGSLESTASEDAVTEVAAGSGIVGPGLFDGYTAFRPEPALHLGFAVVRRPGKDVVTLAGGGWIASGPPGADRLPTVAWPDGLSYVRDEGAGEVQTPLRGSGARGIRIGDTVWLRHAKAGEPAERVDRYVVVRRDGREVRVVDEWPTYRGEGLTTL